MLAPTLCPTFFPPGQECTLPLNPGQYGSWVGGAIDITLPELPDILGRLHASHPVSYSVILGGGKGTGFQLPYYKLSF